MISSLASRRVIEQLLQANKCPPGRIDDIAQDIYLYLLTHQDRLEYYDSLGCLPNYLSKICFNQVKSFYRKKPTIYLDELPEDCQDLPE